MIAMKLLFIVIFCLLVHACKARYYDHTNSGISKIAHSLKVMERFEEKVTNIGKEKALKMQRDSSVISIKSQAYSGILVKGMNMMHRSEAYSVVLKKSVFKWHVPTKHNHQNPGIYADYPKPRSRPPSHN